MTGLVERNTDSENGTPSSTASNHIPAVIETTEDKKLTSPEFIHLKVHTAYSLLEGAVRIDKIADLCEQENMPAVAVTDSDNLFGALEFSETLASKGIQPIIGCSLSFYDNQEEATDSTHTVYGKEMPVLVFMATNETGYQNLVKLASRAYLAESDHVQKPHISFEDLHAYEEGLICLTGGKGGPLNLLLEQGQRPAAEVMLTRLSNLFGDRLYIEIQRHGLREEAQVEDSLIGLAYEHDIPLVATNEVYFTTPQDFESHDALICIAGGSYMVQEDRRRLTPLNHFRGVGEMTKLFADIPEALSNTVEIARRCSFRPETRAPMLPRLAGTLEEEAEALRQQARQGFEERLKDLTLVAEESVYRERLEFELDVIIKMQFPGYFLIVADFVQWARKKGIPVGPGRGSGAGSLVAYALTITDLDPLRFNLLFERFLNPARISMPDFDIDFCQERRDEVIRYVQEKYGKDRVAQIITFGKLQARAVMRDVGRVLQMPYGQVDRLCKMIPNNPANPVTLTEAIEGEPRLQEARREDELVERMLNISLNLEGLYRHASTHAAGVVIGEGPLEKFVPLYRDPRSDILVTQFNMKWVEQAGLVKFDFLGLKTLTVLEKTMGLLRERGTDIKLETIPLDDAKTYSMLSRGDTVGVFQLEGTGVRDTLRRMGVDRIEEIIALVALYRPGPMDNIPKYIACKHGREDPDYLHPSLESILRETFGVIIYQEQVMQIAQKLSGYTLSEADILRRAMGKKIRSEMNKQKKRFISGAVENGVDERKAESIFNLVNKFSGYGFNKSHAAAYALLAYQTAWMKCHYPAEFLAASMTLDVNNTDKLSVLRQEAERMSILVLPPSVIISDDVFTVTEDGNIAYALGAIKNVSRGAMADLVANRQEQGPFQNLSDFANRLDAGRLNKRAIESLAQAGAFDVLHNNRAEVYGSADRILSLSARAAENRRSRQQQLFGEGDDAVDELTLPEKEDWSQAERLTYENQVIGFYLSGHPLEDYGVFLKDEQIMTYSELAESTVTQGKIAGAVKAVRERRANKGNRYAFVELSDLSGEFEAVVFSEALEKAGDILEAGRAVVLYVDIDREGEDIRLRARSIRAFNDMVSDKVDDLRIFISVEAAIQEIEVCLSKETGKGQVSLVVLCQNPDMEVELTLPGGYAVTPERCRALKAINGVEAVQDIPVPN
ncbi:MAG: DNA polymerase III subunit alpha [Parvularculales bacterium]